MSDININVKVVSGAAQASISKLGQEAQKAEAGFKSLAVNIKAGGSALSSFAGNLAAIGVSKVVGAISRGFGTLADSIIDSSLELETAATKFEVLTGSAGRANKIMQELQAFSAKTPFQFTEVAGAAQRLLSFGFAADDVQKKLQVLGDVSAASGSDINELSLIFGQVRAAGKLTGERLLQFQERAIPIGGVIAKSLGVAESSVRDLVSKGKVDFATFEKAFNSLAEKGNFAFEGMDKRSRTLAGRISTLKDNFQLFSAKIGDTLAPALKAGTTALTKFIQDLGDSKRFKDFLVLIADNIPTAIKFMSESLIVGIQIFNSARVGVGNLVAGMFLIVSSALSAAESVLTLVSATGKFTGIDTSGIDQTLADIVALKEAAQSTATDIVLDNDKIVESERDLVSSIRTGSQELVQSYNDELAAAKSAKEATIDADVEKADAAKRLAEQQAEIRSKELEEIRAFEEKRAAIVLQYALAEEEARLIADGVKSEQDSLDLAILQDKLLSEKELKDEARSRELGDQRAFQLLVEQNNVEQLKRQNAISLQQAAIEKKASEDRIQNRKDTFSTIASLSSANNKTLASIGKAAGITQIAIDTPVAVSKALAAFPPPFNFVAAGLVGAAMAAQAARIAGVAFADGGIVPGNSFSGDQVQARLNSGEMVLNKKQQANLFDMANSGGGGQVIQVNNVITLDGDVVARSVSRSVANGLKLGEVV